MYKHITILIFLTLIHEKLGIGYIYCVFYYDDNTLIAYNIISKILVRGKFSLAIWKILGHFFNEKSFVEVEK
jgi:hypothetical protein